MKQRHILSYKPLTADVTAFPVEAVKTLLPVDERTGVATVKSDTKSTISREVLVDPRMYPSLASAVILFNVCVQFALFVVE